MPTLKHKMFRKVLLVLSLNIVLVTSLEPFSTSAVVGALAVGTALYGSLKCTFNECCSTPWLKHNLTEFEDLIDKNVYGQHLVRNLVSKALRSHLRKIQQSVEGDQIGPRKALVLSFHGWTGSGKNYVTQFIVQSLFKLGIKSKFVHLFISTLDFPDETKTDLYKMDLQDWIRGNVSSCPQSVFIFDEIDKMNEGLIDAIKPFIDFHKNINGVDFRKSIFIFLSNTGGKEITEKALGAFRDLRDRESIKYEELEQLVQLGAFNEVGGLHKSVVIEKSLIDLYVPFLPLERKHIRECALAEARKRSVNIPEEIVEKVVNSLTYGPPSDQIFSSTGCKRVSQKIDLLVQDEDDLV